MFALPEIPDVRGAGHSCNIPDLNRHAARVGRTTAGAG